MVDGLCGAQKHGATHKNTEELTMAATNNTVKSGPENMARDVLNAGLGLFRVVSATIDSVQKNVISGYQNLVTKGAADNSDVAKTLRGTLDQGLGIVKDVQVKATAFR